MNQGDSTGEEWAGAGAGSDGSLGLNTPEDWLLFPLGTDWGFVPPCAKGHLKWPQIPLWSSSQDPISSQSLRKALTKGQWHNVFALRGGRLKKQETSLC